MFGSGGKQNTEYVILKNLDPLVDKRPPDRVNRPFFAGEPPLVATKSAQDGFAVNTVAKKDLIDPFFMTSDSEGL